MSPMPLFPILQSMGKVGAVREQVCQWALTRKQTLWGGGLPQGGDLRLLEDGGERGDALGSDVVAPNTASEVQDGNDERVGMSDGR